MPIEKLTTQKITGDYGSLKKYAEVKGLNYFTLKNTVAVLQPVSKRVEEQLEADGYGDFLRIDRQEMVDKFGKKDKSEAVNG